MRKSDLRKRSIKRLDFRIFLVKAVRGEIFVGVFGIEQAADRMLHLARHGIRLRIHKLRNCARARRENVDEFISAVSQYENKCSEAPTLADYLESFSLLEENDRTEEKEEKGVTLSTVHAAKGLEYPVVFIVAMEKDSFPHERSLEEGSVDEEKRLFYVAITRAKKELFLTCSRERYIRGQRKVRIESPFLHLLPEDALQTGNPSDFIKELSQDDLKAAFAKIFSMLDE